MLGLLGASSEQPKRKMIRKNKENRFIIDGKIAEFFGGITYSDP